MKGIKPQKLIVEQQNQICAWIAEGWNSRRIAEKVNEEWDIEISHINIFNTYMRGKKWKPIIKKFFNQLTKEIMSIPIAQKKVRLKELQDTINEAKIWRMDKLYFDKEGNEVGKVEKRNIGVIPALIKEARAEIEGDEKNNITMPVINLVYHGEHRRKLENENKK